MIFIDAKFQEFYEKHGYLILPTLDQNDIELFFKIIGTDNTKIDKPFYISIENENTNERIQLQNKLKNTLEEKYKKLGYINNNLKIFSSSYIYQNTQKESGFDLHTDWSFFDQNINNPVFIWIPLQDVSIKLNNSTMFVLPKSQKITIPYRGEGIIENYIKTLDLHFKNKLEYLDIPKGHSVFFNPGILHGLLPNKSEAINFSLLSTMCEKDAEIIYCYKPKYSLFNKVKIYKVNEIDDYYYVKMGKKNKKCLTLYKTIKMPKTKFTINEITSILEA